MANPTYDVTTPVGKVRLLLSDIAAPWVFTDAEITAFLEMEGDSVKRAAAQAIDTNATNQALASKVLRSQDVQTDGAKLADAMRAHADRLRAQADVDDDAADESAYFGLANMPTGPRRPPELTQWGSC